MLNVAVLAERELPMDHLETLALKDGLEEGVSVKVMNRWPLCLWQFGRIYTDQPESCVSHFVQFQRVPVCSVHLVKNYVGVKSKT